jgi:chemotaxis response regulator CheB
MDERLLQKDILRDSEAAGLTGGPPEEERASGTVLPVVGIGASAGGLEVFRLLLADLPADTGLAIVFVQHLDANHHSLLNGILAEPPPCRSVRWPMACRWKPTMYTS